MRLTPPTKYVFYSSVVFGVSALVLYFVGVIEYTLHFAFWIAIVAWLSMTAGVAAKGV